MRLTTALSNNYIPAVGGLCWESDDCMVCSKGCRDCKVSGSSASEGGRQELSPTEVQVATGMIDDGPGWCGGWYGYGCSDVLPEGTNS